MTITKSNNDDALFSIMLHLLRGCYVLLVAESALLGNQRLWAERITGLAAEAADWRRCEKRRFPVEAVDFLAMAAVVAAVVCHVVRAAERAALAALEGHVAADVVDVAAVTAAAVVVTRQRR